MLSIGVLALQGDFAEHIAALKRAGAEAREIRTPIELRALAGLVIPGGESTTITMLMRRWGLAEPIVQMARSGRPIWGTCAGLIVMAERVLGGQVPSLRLMDLDVARNAYGRQVDSFEAEVPIPALGPEPFPAVFIRAPVIQRVGRGVEVLARLADGSPIAVRQGNLLGSSFHPELTDDNRFHRFLVDLARERLGAGRNAAPV